MTTQQQCNCEEMTCTEGCTSNHTHKGFFCELCKPEYYKEQQCNLCGGNGKINMIFHGDDCVTQVGRKQCAGRMNSGRSNPERYAGCYEASEPCIHCNGTGIKEILKEPLKDKETTQLSAEQASEDQKMMTQSMEEVAKDTIEDQQETLQSLKDHDEGKKTISTDEVERDYQSQGMEERFEKEFEDNYNDVLKVIVDYLNGKISEEEKKERIKFLDEYGMEIYRKHITLAVQQERERCILSGGQVVIENNGEGLDITKVKILNENRCACGERYTIWEEHKLNCKEINNLINNQS